MVKQINRLALASIVVSMTSCAAKYESYVSGDAVPNASLLASASSDLIDTYQKANGKVEKIVLHRAKNDVVLGPVLEDRFRKAGYSVLSEKADVSFQNPFVVPEVKNTKGAVDFGYRASFIDGVGTFCLAVIGSKEQVCRMYVDGKPASAITTTGLDTSRANDAVPVMDSKPMKETANEVVAAVTPPAAEADDSNMQMAVINAPTPSARDVVPAPAVLPVPQVLPVARQAPARSPVASPPPTTNAPLPIAEKTPVAPVAPVNEPMREPTREGWSKGVRIALNDAVLGAGLKENSGPPEVSISVVSRGPKGELGRPEVEATRPKAELSIIQTQSMSNSELSDTISYYKDLLPNGAGESIVSERKSGESESNYRSRMLRHLRLVYAYQYHLGIGYE